MTMPTQLLGTTGLSVTPLGQGLAALGRPGYINLGHAADLAQDYDVAAMQMRAHAVLNAAGTAGVRYFDTARSYGRAEEFLARWRTARPISPGTVTVCSKWGYVYTADCRRQVDDNLDEATGQRLVKIDLRLMEISRALRPGAWHRRSRAGVDQATELSQNCNSERTAAGTRGAGVEHSYRSGRSSLAGRQQGDPLLQNANLALRPHDLAFHPRQLTYDLTTATLQASRCCLWSEGIHEDLFTNKKPRGYLVPSSVSPGTRLDPHRAQPSFLLGRSSPHPNFQHFFPVRTLPIPLNR